MYGNSVCGGDGDGGCGVVMWVLYVATDGMIMVSVVMMVMVVVG